MGGIGVFAMATGQRRTSASVLWLGIVVLLVIDPFLAWQYGFALSVAATAGIIVLVSAWLSSSWYILDLVQRLLFGNRRADLRYADLLRTELAALMIVVLTLLALGIVPISLFGPDRTATSTGAEPPGAHSGSLAWNR